MPQPALSIFNEYIYTGYTELMDQNVAAFNAASGNAIIMQPGPQQGSFRTEAFYANIEGLFRRRNPFADGVIPETTLVNKEQVQVKIASGAGPIRVDQHKWEWIQQSPGQAGTITAQQLAAVTVQDQLNTSIGAFVSATQNVPALIYDSSTSGTLTLNALNFGAGRFGDRSQAIQTWIMHSKVFHDVIDKAITNANRLFVFDTVSIFQDVMGRRFVVTDSPDLIGPTDTYYTLGLTQGAIVLTSNGDFRSNINSTNGFENIRDTLQFEWTHNLWMKGYSWKIATGGAAPTTASLGSSANWEQIKQSRKDLAGVLVVSK